MIVILISGAPGSGKTTQAEKLSKHFGLMHVSTGILLRNEISSGSKLGKLADKVISGGNFVSDEIACQMVKKVISSNLKLKGFIFDGFPRTLPQCHEFNNILSGFNTEIKSFVNMKVPESELTRRLQQRSSTSARIDDSNAKIIKHRFDLYNELADSINEYYKAKGVYSDVNGNLTVDLVFRKIISVLENKLI
ncbi:MAG TPA: nucleoside monophosphate kinase [Bacteroidales bacterium]|nr:nucleoside monophosphate kinase [Bacteroidales bacterium]